MMNCSFLAIPLMVISALSALADQPTAGSTPAYKPRLSGMMSATQFPHLKFGTPVKLKNGLSLITKSSD